MKRQLGIVGTLAALAHLLTPPAQATETIVYAGYGGTYQEAVRKGALEPLAKEMGITIREETISSLADVKVQVEAGSPSMDLSEANVNDCLVGSQQNLWEPLDYSVIDTSGIDPAVVKKDWVGGLTNWSTVLAYSTKKYGDNPPKSWADFWDVEKFPGTRAMWNNPYHNVEIALLADGVAPDKLYPLDLERAFRKLREIKPHITVWYTSGGQATQLLTDGEIDMMPFWNGRVAKVIEDGAPVALTFNQGILAFDCMVVPRGAKNKELAMKVLNRLLAPDMQAAIPQFIAYGPVNSKAYETGKITPEIAETLPSAPQNLKVQVPVNDEWWGDLKNAEKVQEMWTQLVQE
ncbi:ABC transporter substrate-binding protein [Rhodoligotrophos defluvii]|uniref:ABC transporter substrate-binding protein n=1 Tax=Rhodoligotrophos defluvii TaxID=2561934 RepID=UPI0010C9DF25|nr:ABC transporter substrate-binding protein [Rhodoligotrophos defluvii]